VAVGARRFHLQAAFGFAAVGKTGQIVAVARLVRAGLKNHHAAAVAVVGVGERQKIKNAVSPIVADSHPSSGSADLAGVAGGGEIAQTLPCFAVHGVGGIIAAEVAKRFVGKRRVAVLENQQRRSRQTIQNGAHRLRPVVHPAATR
jgi:hypothetical protein